MRRMSQPQSHSCNVDVSGLVHRGFSPALLLHRGSTCCCELFLLLPKPPPPHQGKSLRGEI